MLVEEKVAERSAPPSTRAVTVGDLRRCWPHLDSVRRTLPGTGGVLRALLGWLDDELTFHVHGAEGYHPQAGVAALLAIEPTPALPTAEDDHLWVICPDCLEGQYGTGPFVDVLPEAIAEARAVRNFPPAGSGPTTIESFIAAARDLRAAQQDLEMDVWAQVDSQTLADRFEVALRRAARMLRYELTSRVVAAPVFDLEATVTVGVVTREALLPWRLELVRLAWSDLDQPRPTPGGALYLTVPRVVAEALVADPAVGAVEVVPLRPGGRVLAGELAAGGELAEAARTAARLTITPHRAGTRAPRSSDGGSPVR